MGRMKTHTMMLARQEHEKEWCEALRAASESASAKRKRVSADALLGFTLAPHLGFLNLPRKVHPSFGRVTRPPPDPLPTPAFP